MSVKCPNGVNDCGDCDDTGQPCFPRKQPDRKMCPILNDWCVTDRCIMWIPTNILYEIEAHCLIKDFMLTIIERC